MKRSRRLKRTPRNPKMHALNLKPEDWDEIQVFALCNPLELARRYGRALLLLCSGVVPEAVDLLAEIDSTTHRDITLWDRLAKIYIQHGLIHPILSPFEQCLKCEEPQDPWFYNTLIAAYSQLRLYDASREMIAKKIRLLGDTMDFRLEMAESYEMEGRYDIACQLLEELHRIHPEDGHLLLMLADIYLGGYSYDQARSAFQRILDLSEHTQVPADTLGQAYLALRQIEPAIEAFQRAEPLCLKDPTLPFFLGVCELILGNYERAIRCFRRAKHLGGDVFNFYEQFLGWILTRSEWNNMNLLWPMEKL